jgi:hypothetical protein
MCRDAGEIHSCSISPGFRHTTSQTCVGSLLLGQVSSSSAAATLAESRAAAAPSNSESAAMSLPVLLFWRVLHRGMPFVRVHFRESTCCEV